MTRDEMDQLTAHTEVKAERIRILYRAGAPRAEIAEFLDISYQHVQNVLKRSGLLSGASPSSAPAEPVDTPFFVTLKLGRNNVVTVPDAFVARAGLTEGTELIGTVEAGRFVIMTREQAASLLIEAALRHMPGQADLLGTLLGREAGPRSS